MLLPSRSWQVTEAVGSHPVIQPAGPAGPATGAAHAAVHTCQSSMSQADRLQKTYSADLEIQ